MAGKRRTWDEDVVCPFYKYSSENRIACEGMNIRTTSVQYFYLNDEKRIHFTNHCCRLDNWEECLWARMLMEKYGG